MKNRLSLKWFLALAFVSFGIMLVIGYTLLSANYFINGMDTVMARNLEQAADQYLQAPQTPARPDYPVTRDWNDQPALIREIFGAAPEQAGVMYKELERSGLGRPKAVYFAMRFHTPGGDHFVSHKISPSDRPTVVTSRPDNSLRTLLSISAGAALLLVLLSWLLMRRVARPVGALGDWARGLNEQNLSQPAPDFSYPELNEFASLVRSSLSSVQQSLARERRFVRFTSHELHTPISVIRANVELLERLRAQSRIDPAMEQQALDRIDRASLTMQHLTETLLWLGREDVQQLPVKRIALDALVQELVEQMRYLLNGRAVTLKVQTSPCTLELPEAAARIVLGNLIRNAFQHTDEGRVLVVQKFNGIRISNTRAPAGSSDEDLGFGLGLQLTEQLTARLGWRYSNQFAGDERLAELWIGAPTDADEHRQI